MQVRKLRLLYIILGYVDRTKVCEEWWSKAHDLLMEYGLTRQQLEDAVKSEKNLELREGCEEMFQMLEKNDVPSNQSTTRRT